MADVVLHTHYLTEKNGYYHLSLTAKAFGLSNVIRLLSLKIFADHLQYYRPSQWYSRFHSGTSFAETGKECAFAGIPERLLALAHIPAGVHRKMEQLIDHAVVSALHNAVAKQGEYGGALPHRTLGSVVAGGNNSANPKDLQEGRGHRAPTSITGGNNSANQKDLPACPPELLEIEGIASDVWNEAVALLDIKRAGGMDKERFFLPVDISDFESHSPQRKLLAAVECQKNWEKFIAGCSLNEMVYDKLMKEVSNCPMPYTADQPVAQRLKAAVTGQLMSDVGIGATAFITCRIICLLIRKTRCWEMKETTR